ncbi:type II toxin-antitoxin system HicB family antitoxin [Candidatus Poribacteria bacterium]|nr:type II toxin-antitoxin system HicB family antitoxin [Candidatus Poribacteria bacterium]
MYNEFMAIIERDEDWFIAYCPKIPGANGQGRTIEECKRSLAEAVALILEGCREEALQSVTEDVIKERVVVV